MKWQRKEKAVEIIVSSVGFFSVIVLLVIGFFLFKEAFFIFYKAGVASVIFGSAWYPTYDPPSFGMFPLIMGTLAVTLTDRGDGDPSGARNSSIHCRGCPSQGKGISEAAHRDARKFSFCRPRLLRHGHHSADPLKLALTDSFGKAPGTFEKHTSSLSSQQPLLISVMTNCSLHPD